MIIVLRPGAGDEQIEAVKRRLEERGYGVHVSRGVERSILGAIGALDEEKEIVAQSLEALPFVERVVPILKPYKLVSSEGHPERSRIGVGQVAVGGEQVVVMAGPCSVESREQLLESARAVKQAGGHVLRGGAFKPRTSPYDFQGLGQEGLELLAQAREATGLPVVTEVRDVRQVELVSEYADLLQTGTRNMHNFDLLKELGQAEKPVLLKRGFAATVEEWIKAAEYVAANGNLQIILCERGIRTYEPATRFTLDLSAVPVAHAETHLPVVVDPSHASGEAVLVGPMALAAVAAGADGLLVEVHAAPEQALCDGPQSLRPEAFAQLMAQVAAVAEAVGRCV
ncbi:MAG: 3-deoxy-7-phosphoheptulonate synthase [Armatimonadota bacterium]